MSEAERSEASERRAPRWMWVVLVASLGLDLLVGGAGASAAWHFHIRGFQGRLSGYLDTLPPQRSGTLKGIIAQSRESLQPLREEIRQARREAAQLFAAEPLDTE